MGKKIENPTELKYDHLCLQVTAKSPSRVDVLFLNLWMGMNTFKGATSHIQLSDQISVGPTSRPNTLILFPVISQIPVRIRLSACRHSGGWINGDIFV